MASGGLAEGGGEGFACAVKFAADGVGGLLGEFGDVIVTEVLVRHEEEEDAVFFGEFIQGDPDALAELVHLDIAERAFGGAGGILDDGVIGLGMDIPGVPTAPEIGAVIEGDAIQPGADVGIPSETGEVAPGLEEDVVGGVLGLAGVAQEPEGEVEDLLTVGLVKRGKLRRQGGGPGGVWNRSGFRGQIHDVGTGLHGDWTSGWGKCHAC